MASTKLRLLLDESITEPLASLIIGLVKSVERSTSIVGCGAKDHEVATCANSQRRAVVAIDSDFRKHDLKYGIIKINGPDRADDHCLYQIFYAFWLSGLRKESRKRRTSLTQEGISIRNSEPIERRWHPKPCTKVKGAIRLLPAPKHGR